tara:strand:- start:127 stop:378 length:252 start_codon:yes stop_codon:yes gene_type:complete
MINIFIFLFVFFYQNTMFSDEIIRDENGNYILIKKDGTFKKLPPPKPGNKYVIKKRVIQKKSENKFFKKQTKKSRVKTNQGIR